MVILLIIVIAVVVANVISNHKIYISEYEICTDKISSSLKIVQISDLHNRDWGENLSEKIRKQEPDIIAVTGDLIDANHTNIDIAMDLIEDIKSIAPIYYVSGNHEAWSNQYKELKERLLSAGVIVLDDEHCHFEKDKTVYNIIGLSDLSFEDQDLSKSMIEDVIFAKIEQLKDSNYNIVLCHRPEIFDVYVKSEVDCVLSGHAHGGQFRLPFIGGIIAPDQGIFPTYTKGVYAEQNTHMIVSAGLGNSIIPVRIFNPPELVVITLTKKSE